MSSAALILRRRRRSTAVLALLVTAAGAMQSALYAGLAGETAAARATFAAQSEALARRVTFLAPAPTDLSTLGGYLTWRVFGSLALILGIWAIWFAVSVVRDDERSGITDQVLAAGTHRALLIIQATGAFAAASAFVVAPLCIGLLAGAGGDLPAGGVALQGLAFGALLMTVFALALVAAQLITSDRIAVAAAGGATFGLSLVNSMKDSVAVFAAVSWGSPFAWYGRSEPLVPGGSLSIGALAASLLAAASLTALAAWLFVRRDAGSAVFVRRAAQPRVADPAHVHEYSLPVVATLFEWRKVLAAWGVGALAIVGFFSLAVPGIVASLQQVQALRPYLTAIVEGDVERGIVGLFLIGTMQLYLALLALTFVARWSREERDGRLALELSTPVSRTAVVWRRAGAVGVSGLVVAAAAVVLLALLGPRAGVEIAALAALRTVAALVLFALAVAAVGAVLIAVVPRGAVPGLGLFVGASYFIKEVAPLYGWSDRVLDVSVFHLIGNPLVRAPDPVRIAALMAASVGGFAAAAILLRRRDVAS